MHMMCQKTQDYDCMLCISILRSGRHLEKNWTSEPGIIRKDLPWVRNEAGRMDRIREDRDVRGKQPCRAKAWKKCMMCPPAGSPSPCKKPQATLEGATLRRIFHLDYRCDCRPEHLLHEFFIDYPGQLEPSSPLVTQLLA